MFVAIQLIIQMNT